MRDLLKTVLLCSLLLPSSPACAEPVDIDADQVTRSEDGTITATGHVIIKRTDETLIADQVIYHTPRHMMEASGHVIIRSARATIRADQAQLQTQSHTGTMQHATIILPGGERIQAKQLRRIDDQRLEAEHAIYSSCPQDEESWRIAASHAIVDQEAGELISTHSRLELWQVPVFYTPWWSQPLRRKSGLLIPSVNTGKRRGTELSIPYYIAPDENWDATLTPHWMSVRGMMGEAELRHISTMGYERISGATIDDTVAKRVRGRIKGEMQWQLPAATVLSARADHVSDYAYLADYAGVGDVSLRYLQSEASLSQQFALAETRTDWSLQAQHLQDLLLTSNATTLQILPRLQSNTDWQLHPNAVAHLEQQTTRFDRRIGVDGWRMDLHPYIELPWELSGGGIRSTITGGMRHTRYWLKSAGPNISRPTRTTGEASMELRSDFERISEARHWRHVISPILRYDYVGAPDQSLLPNFDSAFGLLTWSNLLSGNRFSGLDRIEKTNRLSMVVENRLQARNGDSEAARDVLIVRGGAAYDMMRRSVDRLLQPVATQPFSNLLGEIIWQPLAGTTLYGTGQYNPVGHYWSSTSSYLNLTGKGYSLYAGYLFIDQRYSTRTELLDLRGSFSLIPRWQATASWQYDRVLKLSQQATLGIEYHHPCWTLGLETYRINRRSGTTTAANTGFRLLLEFKGLGSVGS